MKIHLAAAAAALALAASPLTVITAGTASAAPCSINGPQCTACVMAHPATVLQDCAPPAGPAPAMFPQCNVYQYGMDRQICQDNVARGFPPDDIRR